MDDTSPPKKAIKVMIIMVDLFHFKSPSVNLYFDSILSSYSYNAYHELINIKNTQNKAKIMNTIQY